MIDVDLVHVGDVPLAVVGVGERLPDLDRQFGVFAVALVVFVLDVLVGEAERVLRWELEGVVRSARRRRSRGTRRASAFRPTAARVYGCQWIASRRGCGCRSGEVEVRELAAGVTLFEVACELVPRVAEVEAVGGVPVIVDRRARVVRGRQRLPGVHDERQAKDQRRRDGHREQGAALEADLLPLALLRSLAAFLVDEELFATAAGYRGGVRIVSRPG